MSAKMKAKSSADSSTSAPAEPPGPVQPCSGHDATKNTVEADPPRENKPEEAVGWIEFSIVDEDDTPLRGVTVKVVDGEGRSAMGRTDDDGLLRVSGLKPGDVEISLPTLAPESWTKE